MAQSLIREFYKNRNVFVTGGTGFVGKVLIEKLLRSTKVNTVYVLIRDKRNKSAPERFNDLFDSPLFGRLKKEKADFRNRVVPVSGDCVNKNLGLSLPDKEKLISNVNVVFHVAAAVNFNEPIKKAYDNNVGGTQNVLNLCREIKDLKAYVHVSTAYSHCNRDSIDEVIYNCPIKSEELEKNIRHLSDHEANRITSKIRSSWPSTYPFTKAIAEEVVQEYDRSFPTAIFRPAIVTSTLKEPLENWSDNCTTVNQILQYVSLGWIKILAADHCNADLIPADLTISALVASAWDVYTRNQKDVIVYNYVSSTDNPITFYEFFHLVFLQMKHTPLKSAIWAPGLQIKKKSPLVDILITVYHAPLALILEFQQIIRLKKPKMILKMYKIQYGINNLVAYFTNRQWKFSNENVKRMWNDLNETDKEIFNFNIESVHWLKYVKNYHKGLRLYLMKEDSSTLSQARTKMKRFQLANKFFLFCFCCIGIGVSDAWLIFY